jgi:hypothetical protein
MEKSVTRWPRKGGTFKETKKWDAIRILMKPV